MVPSVLWLSPRSLQGPQGPQKSLGSVVEISRIPPARHHASVRDGGGRFLGLLGLVSPCFHHGSTILVSSGRSFAGSIGRE